MYDDPLETHQAAASLLYRYATSLDDGPLAHWPRCFTEDGHYRLIPRENFLQGVPVALLHCTSRAVMEERVKSLYRVQATVPYACRHLYTNVQVEQGSTGRVLVRANYAVYHAVDEGEVDLLSVGRLEAQVLLRPETLFERMDVIFEMCRLSGTHVYPL
ncbi:aromatic-ring-hydroxylating dioxygenase subunit beta [Stigmatella sp. ncwal1]|uniref:Aromatic-ring-hydroxylating dioxygenase subunit beta n=1 Tax=Stigmatella ashevillensis TaxID=2995309 RepID=A0ABT5DH30_9BACT|nr:nuclear transport factor 2 family protein [Stigmatella ashevillena]MDC0712979.1 aromatic-ring-hydroxylating dioxygenase subunit beta [Stigmatella ashevillena]